MDFGLLGPLLARAGGREVIVASAKQRVLLATLLLEAPHGAVSTTRLIDELWGEDPPATAGKALQVHVSQLRRTLGEDQLIVTRPSGYAVEIEPQTLDVRRFETRLDEAKRLRGDGDCDGALLALNDALKLWRGRALADVKLLGPGAGEADRLDGLRLIAQEERIELELAQGSDAALVPELDALIAAHPYRERLHGLLMLGLYRAGRQADALAAFRRARRRLVDELGLEPGPELVRLEAAILAQDPDLSLLSHARRPDSRTASTSRGGAVPQSVTPMVGREQEFHQALDLIERPEVRLLTLTGTGGIGKTRLAVELGIRMKDRSRFVDLAALTDSDRVLPAIAAVVGADASEEEVIGALSQEPVILFLDNFEQVIAAAPVVASLLAGVASLTVVVTSRAPLRVAGEHELPLHPLALDLAAELFVRRACDQDPSFEPEADRDAIAAICARVDCLPLAIELAAARTRVFEPAELLDRIGHRLEFLTAGRRDAPERHRTLRATIAWSQELLDADQQRLFAQLAVFRDGWSLDAAEAVANGPVLEALSALVDHCLVMREGSRFRMLETVRDYSAERLASSPDAPLVCHRHASWCAGLAQAAEQELDGPRQSSWFARLDAERENLHAAAAWGLTNGSPEVALEIDGALWRFWLARGAAAEVRDELTAALGGNQGSPPLRAKALNAAGILSGEAGDQQGARRWFEAALELASELGDRRQMARTLMNLGVVGVHTADFQTALTRYREAGLIWQELGDLLGQSIMCQNLAIVYELIGQATRATPLLEQSIELARQAGNSEHLAQTLVELGKHLVSNRPDDPRTPALLHEGLRLYSEMGERRLIIEALEVLAAFNARSGSYCVAAELLGAAEAERERVGVHRSPEERPLIDATIEELEQAPDAKSHELERSRGRSMPVEAAVAVALKSTEHGTLPSGS